MLIRSSLSGFVALAATALVGCPEPGPDPGPDPEPVVLPGPDEIDLDGLCPLEDRYGAFLVEAYDSYTILQGQIADGVVPVTILEEVYSEGGCALLKRNNPFCDPACEPGFTCDFDGECIVFAEPQDLGTVTVDGLVERLEIEPVNPGWNYFSTTLPHPAMTAGETIRITTGDGRWAPFELWGVGVEPLEIPPETTWIIDGGEPVTVTWTPPSGPTWAEVSFRLNIDQHGNSPVTLHCAFEDTGEAEVPAAAVDALLDSGVSGWPNATLSRRTADSADVGEGCAELLVSSLQAGTVELADYIPCNAQTPCPDGMTCDLAIELCQ